MRQLTSRYVPQQSQFECLIQGDSTHETGSFDPWIYLGGPVIKMPASVGRTVEVVPYFFSQTCLTALASGRAAFSNSAGPSVRPPPLDI